MSTEFKASPSYEFLRRKVRKDLTRIRNLEARKKRLVQFRTEVRELKKACNKIVIDLETLVWLI